MGWDGKHNEWNELRDWYGLYGWYEDCNMVVLWGLSMSDMWVKCEDTEWEYGCMKGRDMDVREGICFDCGC